MTAQYSPQWYDHHTDDSAQSAAVIVPIVGELMQPASVIDVGCGRGAWLAEFQKHGVGDILGVDGHWVEDVAIPESKFLHTDLTYSLHLDRQFDLAISLEVGEHLSPEYARVFVHSLAMAAPTVLFSAAIPGQSGVGHVNEQWPDYWIDLFAYEDFIPFDVIRPKIWGNPKVSWWYAQNTLLFCRRSSLFEVPVRWARLDRMDSFAQARLVHPGCFGYALERLATSHPL